MCGETVAILIPVSRNLILAPSDSSVVNECETLLRASLSAPSKTSKMTLSRPVRLEPERFAKSHFSNALNRASALRW